MIEIEHIMVSYTDAEFRPSDIPKLRGYFAHRYPDTHQFHNHLPDNRFDYRLPVIQYRIIDNHPALLGINEGVDLMKKVFFEVDSIRINGTEFHSLEKDIRIIESKFGACEQFHMYEFISPWMALNEENHVKYQNSNQIERNQLLKRILKNNLKTISKGFEYWIEGFDDIQIDGWFKPVDVNFKNLKMLCFKGEFCTNFEIPDYLGLGKQSARGFGVVIKK